jgi:hypothetical protein
MATSDEDRRDLFDLLEAGLGSRGAALLMSHLPPIGWADLATKADLTALGSELRGEIAELRGEMRSMLPKLIAANIASGVGIAGLVLAATKL